MNNLFLYVATVLIWGTTWFAIKLQLGHVAPEVSILYRFVIASVLLMGWCRYKKQKLSVLTLKDHVYMALLALCMCSIHHIFIYSSTQYIPSGVVAVMFSTVSFFNVVYNFIFYRTVPRMNVIVGIFLGILGLVLFFAPDIMDTQLKSQTMKGILLAAVGAMLFSFASVVTKRNQSEGIPSSTAITMASIYGAVIIFLYIVARGIPFVWPQSPVYWWSVVYLTVFGSVVAFLCYLKLVRNVGPAMAGYTTILFPPVALFISSLFESYQWQSLHLLGLTLVLIGNACVIWHKTLRK